MQNLSPFISKHFSKKAISKNKAIFILVLATVLLLPACKKNSIPPGNYSIPQPHLTGVPPLSGMLDRSKIVMKSAIYLDLDHDVA